MTGGLCADGRVVERLEERASGGADGVPVGGMVGKGSSINIDVEQILAQEKSEQNKYDGANIAFSR